MKNRVLKMIRESINIGQPLTCFGKSGIGKTFTFRQMIRDIEEADPNLKVKWITMINLISEIIYAIRNDKIPSLRNISKADILIIDDYHFLTRGEMVQEEFLNIIDSFGKPERLLILIGD